MSQPIDFTFVELRARGEDDAAREVKQAVDKMEKDVDKASRAMGDDLERAFSEAADGIEKRIGGISDSINNSTKKQRKTVVQWGDDVIEVFDDVTDAVGKTAGALGGGGGGGGGSLFSSLAQLGGQLRGISALLPPPLLTALVAAIPAIIALGGALLDLSGALLALPAGIAVLGASFAVLKTAFSGFGDAVSALASGDLEKINEAMKNLAPAAQSVAREINRLREPFSQLRKEVQQSFFAPLVGDLERLGNAVLPTLRRGMTGAAGAFGELGSAILELLGENDIVEVLGDIFESTQSIVKNISPEVVDFLGTLFGVIEHGLPFVERAFAALGDGLGTLTDFLGGSLQTGDFEKFLEDTFVTLSDIFDLGKSLVGLVQAIFGDAGDEGRTFIQTLTEITDSMTAFFESADGQEILQKTLDTLPLIMSALEAGLTILGALVILQNATFNGFRKIGEVAVIAGKAIGEFFQAAWDWIKRAGAAIGDFFVSLSGWFAGVGRSIQDAWNSVVDFGGRVVGYIQALPGQIMSFLQALPGMLASLFTQALDQAAYWVGFGVGTIVQYFSDLPETLWARLQLLISFVTTAFTTVRDRGIAFVLQLVSSVTTFIDELPGKITAGLTALINTVQNFFTRTRDSGRGRISELVSSVTTFFNELPGRITGALNNFKNRVISIFTGIKNSAYNIGRDIINGIKNGIVDSIEGAVGLARRAAGRIVQGFKDALKTGSPSKLTEDEVGAPIMQGVGLGVEREIPTVRAQIDQAVRAIIPNAAGSVSGVGATAGGGQIITFDTGAVQVVFEGVVPTEGEAQRTGFAVGQGIMQTLARQSARTAVRTR